MKLWWAIAAKLYINLNNGSMPQIAIAGYSFRAIAEGIAENLKPWQQDIGRHR